MIKRTLLVSLLLVSLVQTTHSEAKIFNIWGSALAGGVLGNGNASSDRDFFNWASGGGVGFEVGAHILFISAYVDYVRFMGGDAGANLFTFNLGGDPEFSLSGNLKLVIRLAGTFYYGTLDQTQTSTGVSDEVDTRGVGFRGGIGLKYVFAKIFAIGFQPEGAYHYFFGGADDNLLETENNSHGWNLRLMGYLRVELGF